MSWRELIYEVKKPLATEPADNTQFNTVFYPHAVYIRAYL